MNAPDPVVIVGAARTPMGGFLGDLKDAPAHALGARAISAAVERAGIAADSVDEILMGCVLAGGAGAGAGAAGRDRRRAAARSGRDDDQQDVRLRHEGGHGRP